ncbi:GDSL esterase/lipase wdl1 [Orobanche gracilis]
MVGPQRPLFVLFGSSIVQLSFSNGGWGTILSAIYARKMETDDSSTQPSLVIVYFGGNDSMGPHSSGLGPHVPLPEYIENMRKIAIHLKSLSDRTRIIYLSCPPVNETTVRENTSSYFSQLVRTNELCRLYSEACVDLCREMDVKDGVHLSAEGSKVVVEEILSMLKQTDWEPNLHWKSMPTEFSEDSPYDLVASDGKTTIIPRNGLSTEKSNGTS